MTAKPAVQTRRTRWRKAKSDLMMGVTVLATVIALLPLFVILAYLFAKGASSLNLAFFTHMPAPVGEKGGGMANAIVGTLELIGLASLIGVPIGIGSGLYLAEHRGSRFASAARFGADVMMGVPSIVVGIFAYAVVVRPMGGFSTLAGAVALAVIMIPLVTRTTEEMLLLVPHELREAALALGVPAMAHDAVGGRADGGQRYRHRRDPGDRAHRRRDGAAAVHGLWQPLLVDLTHQSHRLADGAGLYLRDFALSPIGSARRGPVRWSLRPSCWHWSWA